MNTVFENIKLTNTSSNAADSIFAAFFFTLQSYQESAKYEKERVNGL